MSYQYYNTVLDVGLILSVCDSICSFAIETTFPLSNFKTKHIFGILMTLRKFLKPWAPQAPPKRDAQGVRNMGRRRRSNFFFYFTAAEGATSPEGEGNPTEGGCFAIVI